VATPHAVRRRPRAPAVRNRPSRTESLRRRSSRRQPGVLAALRRARTSWNRPNTLTGWATKHAFLATGWLLAHSGRVGWRLTKATGRAGARAAGKVRVGIVRAADWAADRSASGARDGAAGTWRWIANAVGRRTTYTCCGQSWTNEDAYRIHWNTHQNETHPTDIPAPAKPVRSDVVESVRPFGDPAGVGRSRATTTTVTTTAATPTTTPPTTTTSRSVTTGTVTRAAGRAARYWQRRTHMAEGAKQYLDSFNGLLEGLQEFDTHADFAARLDDLAAIERQRAEIVADFIADLGSCIKLDHRVTNALVSRAEDGDLLAAFEDAAKTFRSVYESILEAEDNGVAPLKAAS
jgi:hypothetical protein